MGSLEIAPSSERWDGGSDLPLELGEGGVEVDGWVFTLGSLLASPQRDGPEKSISAHPVEAET